MWMWDQLVEEISLQQHAPS